MSSVVVRTVLAVGLLAGCADAAAPTATTGAASATPATTSNAATSNAATTTTTTTTTTTEVPRPDVPAGMLGAVVTRNREDPPKNQFQVELVNRSSERFRVLGVQFIWDGFTTPMVERADSVVAGQTIDFPVPFSGARCTGDGSAGSMPDVQTATVLLQLDDGSERTVPVFDHWGLVSKLYLDDCERQQIEEKVAIEFVGLSEVAFEGRPVTVGELRLTRHAAAGTVRITAIGDTIPFRTEVIDQVGTDVLVLPSDSATAAVGVRFVEARCDAHALAEVKQPFVFVAHVDLGDGVPHPYVVSPPVADRVPMQRTAATSCQQQGLTETLG